jgi:CBS domain-containing protein
MESRATDRSTFLERRIAGEQQTFARPLRALLTGSPVVCREHQTVREAASIMRAGGVGSVVVIDDNQRPTGIFTTTDLIAVAARDADETPLAEVMTRNPVTLPVHALAYEAALAMVGNRIRHVVVMDDERIVGVVSERDLFSMQRLGLGEITTEIRLATRSELLVDIAGEIRKLARLLVEQGVAAEQLTFFVSILNDRLCQRIIEIERKNHHWEGISWCWLAFGSEGRFEQTFSTDQDNGLVFDAHGRDAPDAVREQLLPFARRVNEALDACGFPLCKGNIMASNPALCLSLNEWKERMRGWIDTPEPKALLDASICFDFRPLHGDAKLASALRDWVLPRTRANPLFLRAMADNALQTRPPLGKLRDFATEDAPGAPHTLNLKLYGVRPFVDAARIYALAGEIPQTNTGERLRAARGGHGMSELELDAIVESFFAIQRLRLRAQAALDSTLDPSANRLDPDKLNEFERNVLKEAFRQARKLQSRIALDYRI